MAEIIMPKMGDAMTEGKVVRWYKKAGDPVKKGEPVLEIETDKVNLDLEAEEDGILGGVDVAEGAMAPVGAVLAVISADGSAPAAKSKPAEAEKAAAAPASQPKEAPKESKPAPEKAAPKRAAGERVKSSPLARRMAKDLGVDLAVVEGSGPGGRIVARDVEAARGTGRAAAAARPAGPKARAALQTKDVPLTAMRRTIAKRLSESIGPVPHFFLTVDLDVTQLMALRSQLNEMEEAKVSVNDFVIRAAALALLEHPNVNATFLGESIREHGDVHIGIAVATPEGLITPIVRNADTLGVLEISTMVRELAERARNRKLTPDEYQGATFTISNLGMFGIEEFTAIINPPNSAILAVGAASQKPVVIDGNIVIRDRMRVTMSCDHRVVDGAAGAQYLQSLRKYIEQPLRLIL
ncbi:MAG: dihydrolipoamide acetyltransferase family protein [Thermoanaerobaculia bacterium]